MRSNRWATPDFAFSERRRTDDIDGSYSRIEFSERHFPQVRPPDRAHVRATLRVIDEHPDWKELPHDVHEVLRERRHDISLETVTYVLANLGLARSRLR